MADAEAVCLGRGGRMSRQRRREAALAEAIRVVLSGSPFHGEDHCTDLDRPRTGGSQKLLALLMGVAPLVDCGKHDTCRSLDVILSMPRNRHAADPADPVGDHLVAGAGGDHLRC